MKVGDKVRIYYDGKWFDKDVSFDEGDIEFLDDEHVIVDFLDWKQRFRRSDVVLVFPFTGPVYVASTEGEIVQDYRC